MIGRRNTIAALAHPLNGPPKVSDRTKQRPSLAAKLAEERLQRSGLGKIKKELDVAALAEELQGSSKDDVVLQLFLALLLQHLHNASDEALEGLLHDNLAWMAFCGLDPEREKPSLATIIQFRNCLHQTGKWKRLMALVNDPLAAKGLKLKYGAIDNQPFSLVISSVHLSAEKNLSNSQYEAANEQEDSKPQ